MPHAAGTYSLLAVWVAVLWLHPTEACMETAWSIGYLSPAEGVLVETVTMARPGSGGCSCCDLCRQFPGCASLAFRAASGECRLYDQVASYASLTPHADWQYLVMANRSEHGQFCRSDADCRAAGDACRGRVCTARTAVTCRVIRDQLGAGDKYGAFVPATRMYGWLTGHPLPLACLMTAAMPGYTRLFQNKVNFKFTRRTILHYNTDLVAGTVPHSILDLAEDLRQLGTEPTYQLVIESPGLVRIAYQVPRAQTVLAAKPRRGVAEFTFTGRISHLKDRVSLPYLPASGPTLLTVHGHGSRWYRLSLAREDGSLTWGGNLPTLYMYLRE